MLTRFYAADTRPPHRCTLDAPARAANLALISDNAYARVLAGRAAFEASFGGLSAAHVQRARPLIRAANPLSVGAHLVLGDNGQRRRQRILKRLWVG